MSLRNSETIHSIFKDKLLKQLVKKLPKQIDQLNIVGLDLGQELPQVNSIELCETDDIGDTEIKFVWIYKGGLTINLQAQINIKLLKAVKIPINITITIHSIEGNARFRIYSLPSTRFAFSFEEEPQMEMTVNASIGSKNYTGWKSIQKQIQNAFNAKIKTIVCQRLVSPNRYVGNFNKEKEKTRLTSNPKNNTPKNKNKRERVISIGGNRPTIEIDDTGVVEKETKENKETKDNKESKESKKKSALFTIGNRNTLDLEEDINFENFDFGDVLSSEKDEESEGKSDSKSNSELSNQNSKDSINLNPTDNKSDIKSNTVTPSPSKERKKILGLGDKVKKLFDKNNSDKK